jgi:hypothetical protein
MHLHPFFNAEREPTQPNGNPAGSVGEPANCG